MSAAFMETLCNFQHFVEHAENGGLTWSLLHNLGTYELRLFTDGESLPRDVFTGPFDQVAKDALHALAVSR